MASASTPTNEKKRVKVYELRNNDWFDRGTGFCMGQLVSVCRFSSSAQKMSGPAFRMPGPGAERGAEREWCRAWTFADACPKDEWRIYVESEDEPERILLETKISKDDGYQKQQGLQERLPWRCFRP
jgi:protein phosphatase 4 regulatory subunit 3